MRRASLSLVFSLLGAGLLGCAGEGFEPGAGDNQDAVAPLEPGLFHSFSAPTRSECSDYSDAANAMPIDIQVAHDGSTLKFTRDDARFFCASGKLPGQFDCTFEVPQAPHRDAQFKVTGTLTLRAVSGDLLEGRYVQKTECAGALCADVGAISELSFPCLDEGEWFAVRAMPAKFVPKLGAYDLAVGAPVATTCDNAPHVAERQQLRIEAQRDGTALVFADSDPVPHSCEFTGQGFVDCSRRTEVDGLRTDAIVMAAWTGAESFEGTAQLELRCTSGSCPIAPGPPPCSVLYHIRGSAAAY
jgi:hypothetical protein